ncbi:MAG TPA: argininosuccinate lyase [Candidatus Wallbacteria bacterium]|nr:argininosuccinate lyase [Candidatus Wallbacteria bacterium]
MKKVSVVLMIVAILMVGMFSFITAKAEDGSANDFTLVNRTGYSISSVYVGASKSDSWGEDILGQDILENGASVDIKFHPDADVELYDIKVVYKVDNSSAVWYGFDLTKLNKITIFYDAEANKTTAESE